MVLMSKITPSLPPGSFTQADLGGPWRLYLQTVESKLQASTWQVGLTTFTSGRRVRWRDPEDINTTPTILTAGSLLVSANGSVTGTPAPARARWPTST